MQRINMNSNNPQWNTGHDKDVIIGRWDKILKQLWLIIGTDYLDIINLIEGFKVSEKKGMINISRRQNLFFSGRCAAQDSNYGLVISKWSKYENLNTLEIF